MDFVTDLPPDSKDNNAIFVVVDRLTKMVHFAPCRTTINAVEAAQLFYRFMAFLRKSFVIVIPSFGLRSSFPSSLFLGLRWLSVRPITLKRTDKLNARIVTLRTCYGTTF